MTMFFWENVCKMSCRCSCANVYPHKHSSIPNVVCVGYIDLMCLVSCQDFIKSESRSFSSGPSITIVVGCLGDSRLTGFSTVGKYAIQIHPVTCPCSSIVPVSSRWRKNMPHALVGTTCQYRQMLRLKMRRKSDDSIGFATPNGHAITD